MGSIVLAHAVDWDGFRAAARTLALDGVAPEQAAWSVAEPADLFAAVNDGAPQPPPGRAFTLPRALVELAQTVIQARAAERFALLYGLVFRAHGGERHLLEQVADPAVARANRLAQAVRRDTHRMRAFLRFHEVPGGADHGEARRFVAWFEPEHFIVEANAGFFARRFAAMAWSVVTPYRSVHWDGAALAFAAGVDPRQVPDDDRLATYWQAHFSGDCNPGRPQKYWRNLPEPAAIPDPIRAAQGGTESMVEPPVTSSPRSTRRAVRPAPAAPGSRLAQAAAEAADCRRCPLWQPATQTVFGEGAANARIMFVGEQPGDQEDLTGRPFVGPAGQLFDRAMAEAGLDRAEVYVTNAVKHFKFEPRGKRRIHAKPDTAEIVACAPWLEIERAEVRPRLVVVMGATAARAVLGRAVAITRERGKPMPLGGGTALVTVHPSYLLRLPDEASKAREYAAFVADLRLAARLAEAGG